MTFSCEIFIRPREDILDPQGETVEKALHRLGFTAASSLRIGRYMRLSVDAADEAAARQQIEDMCGKLLANPVTEDYEYELKAS